MGKSLQPRARNGAADSARRSGKARFGPALLRENREFRAFWIGQLISLFGDQITLLALPLLAVLLLNAGAQEMGYLAGGGADPDAAVRPPRGRVG